MNEILDELTEKREQEEKVKPTPKSKEKVQSEG